MSPQKRRIVVAKRTPTATFAEDEQPTTRHRAACDTDDAATTQRRPPGRPPLIRRSSGTRPIVRVDQRPTARPPRPVSSGVVPVLPEPPPVVRISTPPPPRSSTPPPVLLDSRPPPAATWLEEPAREVVVELEAIEVIEETPTIPRRVPRRRPWGARVALAVLVIACELWLARHAGVFRGATEIATRALAWFVGD